MANEGKRFERRFKEAADKQGLLCIRFNDSDMSFNPNREFRSRFTAKNPADFFIYRYPYIYFLELKSSQYSSISFEREEHEKKMIHLSQIQSLSNLVLYNKVRAGLLLNFRSEEEGEVYTEETYYMSIENFNDFLCNTDKKSVNKNDILMYGGFEIESQKKRKLYTYNVESLLNEIDIRKEVGANGPTTL